MMFTILTLFPAMFSSPLDESVIRRARDKGLVSFNVVNIRDYAHDIHRTCDDAPYGGGPGMVMKVEPMCAAIEYVAQAYGRPWVILLSPQGRPFSQAKAVHLARRGHVCLLCGRYEGVDERILSLVDEEISIGDYVLSGGEIPALAVIDAVVRQVPGVLGNDRSNLDESFTGHILEYPQYTRPDTFMGMDVPSVLLSGNHEEIRKWRRKEAIRKTILKRPDLMERLEPTDEDRRFIREILEEIPG